MTDQTLYVEVIAAALRRDRPWTLSDGARDFEAVVTDGRFWTRLEAQETALRRGQFMQVRMRLIQTLTELGSRPRTL